MKIYSYECEISQIYNEENVPFKVEIIKVEVDVKETAQMFISTGNQPVSRFSTRIYKDELDKVCAPTNLIFGTYKMISLVDDTDMFKHAVEKALQKKIDKHRKDIDTAEKSIALIKNFSESDVKTSWKRFWE